MPATIKLRQLKNACQPQQDLFRRLFGAEVHLTLDLAKQYAPDFDFNWAAVHLLPAPLLAEYERQKALLLTEYERQKAPLWAEYQRQEAPLLAEYERQKAPLLAEYERQQAPLLAEYERQQASLWAEYDRQKAQIFTTLYLEAP